ncbi:16S rRNA (guanine(966)-N(2))-methyltransferase RsmD [Clostridium botulinum]|uniref:16S rRNA (Guanine(966)-N(2))-methyltransferase RsmD n=1 Tax=Clostridium botulinum TaxID=1491 RepID=A0A6B4JKN0_CLOBO|nr:16S rRNA (guanine(966)-N(2))-methyltransferase RsmD [Clostridium botulinum]EES50300.1 RNA methyltransferase, RsmD family [Clostridium botulinum E1 str. 'BoNT E Beluga']MBY6760742.1 16S rRNA (guanine(966)-N(2))-methyltransferase RsmD [Clostridium botulinum]MBY6919966.1 16S rRNA (guanine(966)-N(2))-methyltransferase RsmD [Clostridium botulinum]MCR1130528.1 16S rRNA (guanine(966)-N(2))-methyltransferase RsmD [Clostridium botulinum]NFJ57432.1 16S rRNA (guanine(966)-N(2))-methyltransferase RsmD 
MRIISGKARGRKLIPPASMETRPTLDRVKEAMFSMIQGYIPDSNVIDVFAGTGSLGLEAASRGAKEVYLIDKSSETFPLLKENIKKLKFDDFCFGLNMDSYEALRKLSNQGKVFELIFIDPPYCKEMIPEAIKIIKENNILSENGIIITKIDTIEEIYDGYEDIFLRKSRKYGNTTVCFYGYKED